MGSAPSSKCGGCIGQDGFSIEHQSSSDVNVLDAGDQAADRSVSWTSVVDKLSGLKTNFQPKVVVCKDGQPITIRLPCLEDKASLSAIADVEAAGSGMSGDPMLFGCFEQFLAQTDTFALWAEEEAGQTPLGLLVVTMSSAVESFWHTLRVNKQARCKGVAGLLFKEAATLCTKVQGPEAISRWGVVSSNDIMNGWSTRMKLGGPLPMRRFMSQAVEVPDTSKVLPPGWTVRTATEDDEELVFTHINGKPGRFQMASSSFGTLNLSKIGGAGTYQRHQFAKAAAQKITEARPTPQNAIAPLLFDETGSLAGFCTYLVQQMPHDPSAGLCFIGYVDGTQKGIQVILELLRHEAATVGCKVVMGYVPTLDWMLEDLGESSYKRASQVDELFYNWKNADFVEKEK